MKHEDFSIGLEFYCMTKYRCTDVGTRTIIAIGLDNVLIHSLRDGVKSSKRLSQEEAEKEGWFKGPPYASQEIIFDENDIEACTLHRNTDDNLE